MTARPRIAVCDDDPMVRDLLAEWLAVTGYTPVVFANGAAALAGITAEPPALIMLDYVMPEMDGPAILRALQADPRLRTVPVILVTGEDVSSLPGVAAVFRKPFRPKALGDALQSLVARASAAFSFLEPEPVSEGARTG